MQVPHANWTGFRAGSAIHIVCGVTLVVAVWIVCRAGSRARKIGPGAAVRFDRRLAALLAVAWFFCQAQDLMPGHLRWDRSLPLHICDIVGLAAPIAITGRRRLLRAMLYFWGIGLSTQAFLTPVLFRGPATLDFWTYWLCHFAIVVPAVYDLVIRGYRPDWRDWRRMVVVGVTYTAVVMPVNIRLGVNYGYLGRSDFGQTTLVQLLGPWPMRVPVLLGIVWGSAAVMTVPWTIRRGERPDASGPFPMRAEPEQTVNRAA